MIKIKWKQKQEKGKSETLAKNLRDKFDINGEANENIVLLIYFMTIAVEKKLLFFKWLLGQLLWPSCK